MFYNSAHTAVAETQPLRPRWTEPNWQLAGSTPLALPKNQQFTGNGATTGNDAQRSSGVLHIGSALRQAASMAWKRSTVRTRPGPPQRFIHLPSPCRPHLYSPESNRSPNLILMHGQLWASCGFRCCPLPGHPDSMSCQDGAPWAPFFTLVVCWRRQQFLSLYGCCPVSAISRSSAARLPIRSWRSSALSNSFNSSRHVISGDTWSAICHKNRLPFVAFDCPFCDQRKRRSGR